MNQEVKTADTDAGAAPSSDARVGTSAKKAGRKTKSDAVIALLSRSRGATLDEMIKATGWQPHSVRGFLAGTVKKKLGHTLTSETGEKGRVYRIAPEAK